MKRSQIGHIQTAFQTSAILKRGTYAIRSGQKIPLSHLLQIAVGGTEEFAPEAQIPSRPPYPQDTVITVKNQSTLAAAFELYEADLSPVILNFASARNPGGGFWLGATAQEESLCRATGLFACLRNRDFYRHQKLKPSSVYTDHMIYSPSVPVFRGDSGELLEDPWPVAIITSAAPNATILKMTKQYDEATVKAAFESRIRKVLALGAYRQRQSIVLGAWGCGAFGNDPEMVAGIFGRVIREEFPRAYTKVVFAILDRTPGDKRVGAFRRVFENGER